jgi:hypothetical protein
LDEIHKSLMELALGKYIRTYDWTAVTYYWPHMSLDIKCCVYTCNIS